MNKTFTVAILTLVFHACKGGDGATAPPPPPQPKAAKLVFVSQPTTTEGNVEIVPWPRVVLQDQFGNTYPSDTTTITLSLVSTAPGASLGGTTSLKTVAGMAIFSNLRVDNPGSGFTLRATSGTLTGATSDAFDIRLTFVHVSVGIEHTCGLTFVGFVYCWGGNESGQLGDGTLVQRLRPTAVAGRLTFAQLSVGSAHTCALTMGGTAYCWGSNYIGQLGDNTPTTRNTPTPVAGGLTFTQMSAGFDYSCALSAASEAYCWGANVFGNLGDGTGTPQHSPTLVSTFLRFTQISAGGAHTCGIATDRHAYCWGWGSYGRLGDGTEDSHSTPNQVSGGLTFTEIGANPGSDAEGHSCAVIADGTAYCWGSNFDGEVGDGTAGFPRITPTPVSGNVRFTHLNAARGHTCALAQNGTLYCWGRNANGESGDGTLDPHLVPTLAANAMAFTQASAWFRHSCGVTAIYTVYCWGLNDNGQLGDGTTTQRLTPTRVFQ